jgi:glycosyltransferase involved in cell wall biosynthesis
MRILHLVQRYYPAQGGAEVHIREISAYLAAAGCDVTVATTDALDFELFWDPKRRRATTAETIDRGVTIHRFPVRHLPAPQLAYAAIRRALWLGSFAPFVPTRWLERLSRFTPWTPDLWRWLETTADQFDLIAGMTICFEPLLAAGLAAAKRRGVPFVAYPLTHLGAGKQPGRDVVSRFYTMRHQVEIVRQSDAALVQTETEKRFYENQGIPSERLIIAGPGVTPTEVMGGRAALFRQKHGLDGPFVLFIGSLSSDKGINVTIEAVRHLWAQGVMVDLVLIGAILSPFKRYWDSLPADARERVQLLGPVDDQEKKDALAACSLLALPSRTDSFGIAYLEAWLYGKPVIGAQTWGVQDVIGDGEDGLLVPFGNAPALAAAIQSLLNDPQRAEAMGERGRQKTLANYTWPIKGAISADVYKRLTSRFDGVNIGG